MAKCKSCGADITFIKTASGKSIPCNLPSRPYIKDDKCREVIITPNGAVVSGMFISETQAEPDGYGYLSHFATCPQASKWRK